MKLSIVTYDELVANGVDMGKLGECVNSASDKRTVKNEKFTQSGKAFTRSESAAISRSKLTDPEDLALTIVAFDTAMLKSKRLGDWKAGASRKQWLPLRRLAGLLSRLALPSRRSRKSRMKKTS